MPPSARRKSQRGIKRSAAPCSESNNHRTAWANRSMSVPNYSEGGLRSRMLKHGAWPAAIRRISAGGSSTGLLKRAGSPWLCSRLSSDLANDLPRFLGQRGLADARFPRFFNPHEGERSTCQRQVLHEHDHVVHARFGILV